MSPAWIIYKCVMNKIATISFTGYKKKKMRGYDMIMIG